RRCLPPHSHKTSMPGWRGSPLQMPMRRPAPPFPPEPTESVPDTTVPSATTKTEPTAIVLPLADERRDDEPTIPSTVKTEPTGPLPRRTLFAVVLQIPRCFGPLC